MADSGDSLNTVFNYIDEHQQGYVDELGEWVAIESVSSNPQKRKEIDRMVEIVRDKILACKTTPSTAVIEPNPVQPGQGEDPLPGVIFGSLGADPNKYTILVYGHLDVQPAAKSDGWNTEPFVMEEDSQGRMWGRGSTDDKGPVLAWLNCIAAYEATGIELPVNLKFVFEGMEESGSEGLEELIAKRKAETDFFDNVDFVCISDNYWLGKEKPCLTYGLRGICYFYLEVECSTKDLHSGVFGGTVHEGMNDLMYLMSQLVDKNGKILVPGLYDNVPQPTEAESALYTDISFDVNEFATDAGVNKLVHETKKDTLMHRWRWPSLSIHGIEGAFSDPGAKTVIPRKVIGKFSVRIVPNMTEVEVEEKVVSYINSKYEERYPGEKPNKMKCSLYHGGRYWVSEFDHPHYEAGKRATRRVWKQDPDFTREGGSIPVTIVLQEATQKNTLLLPLGRSDDGAHSQNEKFDRVNYIEGTKLLAAYMKEVSAIDKSTLS